MTKSKNRVIAGLFALLLAAGLGLTACTQDTGGQNVTPPAQTDGANTDKPADTTANLTEKDAQSLVNEKLPEGYTSKYVSEIQSDEIQAGRKYKIFDVSNPDGKKIGAVAIDLTSGDRYNYTDDGKLTDYSQFALYDAATDAICDWNGTFQNGDLTVELMQGDPTSFEFQFSDDTAGVARIQGNTASYNDGELTFAYGDDGSVRIGGTISELAGTYQPVKEASKSSDE